MEIIGSTAVVMPMVLYQGHDRLLAAELSYDPSERTSQYAPVAICMSPSGYRLGFEKLRGKKKEAMKG